MKDNLFLIYFFSDGQIECSEEKETCEAMLASYNTVFTYFLLTSSLSGVFFDPIHQKFGTFAIRCILGGMTTLGLVLFIFYQDNSNIIYGVWQLIGLPSSFYIVTNTKELCPIFPKVRDFRASYLTTLSEAKPNNRRKFFVIWKFEKVQALKIFWCFFLKNLLELKKVGFWNFPV